MEQYATDYCKPDIDQKQDIDGNFVYYIRTNPYNDITQVSLDPCQMLSKLISS